MIAALQAFSVAAAFFGGFLLVEVCALGNTPDHDCDS